MLKKYQLSSYNFRLIALIIVTCAFALSVVNSANSSYTLKQGIGMAVAFIMMIILSFIDYNWILKYFWLWYAVGVILLIAVIVFGANSHGATRWIRITPSLQLQPSEFMKIIIILFMSKIIAMFKERLNTFRFLALFALLVGFPLVLVIVEPDLSTTLLLFLIIVTVIYCAGLSYKIIGLILLVSVPVIAGFLIYVVSVENPIIIKTYQRERIVDFLNGKSADEDVMDDGTYQQSNAVQAIGSGQLSGKGLNNNDPSSLKNAGYIAEAQNDFIFAVIGEELGFIGSCATIILLFFIVFECIISAVKAKNFEGRLICCGVAAYIAFQTFMNMGVVTWILPNTGIPLPFFSCGITSLITTFVAMGIVLNVNLKRNVDRNDITFADDFRG